MCTPRGNLSAFMQQFQTSYTVYFNRRYGRVGHLFAGRYKAKLVEGGHYLLGLTRYVHLNPVKTKRARALPVEERRQRLHEYRWSSFRDHSGLSPTREWITYRTLEAFRETDSDALRRERYRLFVEQGLDSDDDAFIESLSRSSKALGGEDFRRR